MTRLTWTQPLEGFSHLRSIPMESENAICGAPAPKVSLEMKPIHTGRICSECACTFASWQTGSDGVIGIA